MAEPLKEHEKEDTEDFSEIRSRIERLEKAAGIKHDTRPEHEKREERKYTRKRH